MSTLTKPKMDIYLRNLKNIRLLRDSEKILYLEMTIPIEKFVHNYFFITNNVRGKILLSKDIFLAFLGFL